MRISQVTVTAIATDVLKALGASTDTADSVIHSLLEADRRNCKTHGLSLMPLYADLIEAGIIEPRSTPEVQEISRCLARVDGHRAFGQLAAQQAVEQGLKMLPQEGIAAVSIIDGTHLGRLGQWAEYACRHGAAFLAFTNTAGGARNVAGPGSSERVLSTNPIALGVPTFGALQRHVVVDFASSQVSGSRIREVHNAGGKLDPDWTVAEDGGTTDDPEAFLSGAAALLPLGGRTAGHKGFGLMVASEMLAALGGSMMAGERDEPGFSNGALFCFIDVKRFVEPAEWGERARHFSEYLAELGYRLPGTGKVTSADEDSEELEIAEHILGALIDLASTLNVDTRDIRGASPRRGAVRQTW
ncbi:MAG: putative oxidoreductase [Halieaceae bacterium]|jgi:LDH2 family malate/lactate/ureidoglycolate dehydrogenase